MRRSTYPGALAGQSDWTRVAETPVDNLASTLKLNQHTLIVTGAAGRIGRALHVQWGAGLEGAQILWSARKAGQAIDLVWDIGESPAPSLPKGAVFLHLAGETRGDAVALAENRRSAAALCAAALESGARHVFLMSSAAVYRPQASPIEESQTPDPVSDYGCAKLDAEQAMRHHGPGFGLTVLRLGNLAGADALLSSARKGPVVLDPIPGQTGGPERSYIGPRVLAAALSSVIMAALQGETLPDVLNLAQEPALPLADLLTAFGALWHFGPPRPAAIPRVALSVARLKSRLDLPKATPAGIVADLSSLTGLWP